ncbi:MAG TPA: hypothetical protein VHB79_23150 [Polyangiaceae bacterium]|nr:hypothetical protein [Polyangiaceae bacterium]
MMASKQRTSLALGACLWLCAGLALAQPTPAQKETARGLMAEGRELRDQGDMAAALTRFSAADSIMNVPTTGFEVAATQAQLGQLVEARETLRRVLALPQSPDDPEPFNEARSKARALDQQLAARIGSLRFAPSGSSEAALDISVDGERVPRAVLSLPFRVNPGNHQIVARSRGRELRREVVVAESQAIEVPLPFDSDATPAAAPPAVATTAEEPAPPAADAVPPGERHGLPPLVYAGAGVGLAGIVVGSVAGISAISHKNAAKKDCVASSCPPSTWSDLDSARQLATISTVGFAAGALGLGVAAGALLLDKPSPSHRAWLISPDVGPHGAHVTVAGRF